MLVLVCVCVHVPVCVCVPVCGAWVVEKVGEGRDSDDLFKQPFIKSHAV